MHNHAKARSRVLVVQRRLTHYRAPFFEALKRELDQRGIDLVLACGTPMSDELSKRDSGEISWSHALPTRYFFGGRLCWQPYQQLATNVDLVVIALENKLLFNLWSQFFDRNRKVALWGHGANLQGDPHSLREKFKSLVAKKADWWFGYTDMSLPLITRTGFPAERITILNNAVDTNEIKRQMQEVDSARLAALRQSMGILGNNVGIYIGSLYSEKRIEFLLQSCLLIRQRVPDFEMLIVGAGPDETIVRKFTENNSWIHYLGPQKGQAKVDLLRLAKLVLNPGLVGLGILDSFVCQVPLVTTDCGIHSPEIVYQKNDVNGIMTSNSQDDFVRAVVDLLSNENSLNVLRQGCAESAKRYTVENMAINFAEGVAAALEAPTRRFR
jgi:L-malate glycosyltransferase